MRTEEYRHWVPLTQFRIQESRLNLDSRNEVTFLIVRYDTSDFGFVWELMTGRLCRSWNWRGVGEIFEYSKREGSIGL